MCNNEHGCLSNGPDSSLPAARVTYDRVFHEPRNTIVKRVMMRGNVWLFRAVSQLAKREMRGSALNKDLAWNSGETSSSSERVRTRDRASKFEPARGFSHSKRDIVQF